MIRSLFACALLLTTSAGTADVQEDRPGLESLRWLAGHWRQETPRAVTEELWLPPRGGMMLGLNRTSQGEKGAFEYLRIQEDDGGVVYLASPSGSKPTPFRLKEVDDEHVFFENPEHDFPKWIEYRLEAGKLTASIGADKPGPSWTFERVKELD